MGERVEFPSNGGDASGYLATPEAGTGPGLIVIQEWWGLVPDISEVCDRLGREGFVALAPDLYHGTTTTEPDDAAKLMMAMNLSEAAKDMGGALLHLQGHQAVRGDGVGVIGFCMGGGLALTVACQQPNVVRACVSFYGLIPWEHAQPDWSRSHAAIELHVAADDQSFTPDQAHALQAKLDALGKEATVHVYEGAGHAFFNDTRPEVYDAEAASLAWTRTLSFLRAHLG